MSTTRQPGVGALVGLIGTFAAVFIGVFSWERSARDQVALDARTHDRLRRR